MAFVGESFCLPMVYNSILCMLGVWINIGLKFSITGEDFFRGKVSKLATRFIIGADVAIVTVGPGIA